MIKYSVNEPQFLQFMRSGLKLRVQRRLATSRVTRESSSRVDKTKTTLARKLTLLNLLSNLIKPKISLTGSLHALVLILGVSRATVTVSRMETSVMSIADVKTAKMTSLVLRETTLCARLMRESLLTSKGASVKHPIV